MDTPNSSPGHGSSEWGPEAIFAGTVNGYVVKFWEYLEGSADRLEQTYSLP